MTAWSTVTWDVARVGGLVAYVLLAVSVALGLLLSMGWRSPRWTRFVTNDLHRFVTLLALVFTGVHTLGVWLDPFMAFTPVEVLVPLVSHYRAVWVALGIVSSYLLIALWLSERIRPRVGYTWWRRFHELSFVAYVLVTIHSIGTGSDTRAWWAILLYFGSAAVITVLTVARLVPTDLRRPSHPLVAGGALVVAVAIAGWAVLWPFQPGWNAIANGGHGSGESLAFATNAVAQGAAPGATPDPTGTPAATLGGPFQATFQGTVEQSGQGGAGAGGLVIAGTLSGGLQGTLQIALQGRPADDGAFAVTSTQLTLHARAGPTCSGQISAIEGERMSGGCTSGDQSVRLDLRLRIRDSGSVAGVVTGTPQ